MGMGNIMGILLDTKNIDYFYQTLTGKVQILSNISFSLVSGEFISIMGPPGCGKSTLLSIITGILPVTNGSLNTKAKNIGYLIQQENSTQWLNTSTNSDIITETYGITAFNNCDTKNPYDCMKKRAQLIKSLCLEPDITLLDEPFNALDYVTRLEVGNDIRNMLKSSGKSGIMVTNDLSEAIALSDRIIIMSPAPGHIKAIVPIKITTDRSSPINARNAPEFREYYNELWNLLSY